MNKQSCVAAHSTDAEIRAFHQACQLNWYLRVVCTFLKIPLPGPTITWEDNQAAIDISDY